MFDIFAGKPLAGKRALVTQADDYMGPAISKFFTEAGAEVIPSFGSYEADSRLPAKVVAEAGRIDILVINLRNPATQDARGPAPDRPLASPASKALAHEETEEAWQQTFDRLVHPT